MRICAGRDTQHEGHNSSIRLVKPESWSHFFACRCEEEEAMVVFFMRSIFALVREHRVKEVVHYVVALTLPIIIFNSPVCLIYYIVLIVSRLAGQTRQDLVMKSVDHLLGLLLMATPRCRQ
jgi:hypothetical protein